MISYQGGTWTVTATNLDVQIGGSDSLTIGTFPDNEPINIAQMNGVAVTMGNGASGTGVQRVTIASDSTGQVTCNAGTNLNTSALATSANQSTMITSLSNIDTDTTTIIGHVDGIEGLIGTTNTNTSNTATSVSSIDGKLPTTAAMADNTSNPTVTKIGSYLMGYDGSTWDRVLLAQPSADNVGASSFQGVVSTTTLYGYDGTNFDRVRADSGSVWVQGGIAHDAADSGNPVKIGGKAFSLDPSSSGTIPGPTAVAANDRVDQTMSLQGGKVEAVHSFFQTLTAINTTYDTTSTETNTSARIDTYPWRYCTLMMTIDSTSTPTDIQIQPQVSEDDTNYFDLKNGALGQWIYDDTYVATAKNMAYNFEVASRYMKVQVTATGLTSGSAFFDITNAAIHCRN